MHASGVLQLFLEVACKASQIATVIRKERTLLELLIEEKPKVLKNDKYFQDFKTFADVLIQETVRHYISVQIPDLGESIYGEESNTFTNATGDSITVKVCNTQEETKELLSTVLGGNNEAASLLAEAVHCSDKFEGGSSPLSDGDIEIDTSDCGVWIDPIDATGQYIKGDIGKLDEHGLVSDGLQCVAILIGLFQKSTGKPVLGVAVQPFSEWNPNSSSWNPNTVWGICYKELRATSFSSDIKAVTKEPKIVMSKSESEDVQKALVSKYKLVSASGAGYKILVTVLGLVNAYVLSHRSIYRWDCCALHAILLAMEGGIISYKHALELARHSETSLKSSDLDLLQVNYMKAAGAIASRRCSVPDNAESLPGIIAYKSATDAMAILELLKLDFGCT